MTKPSGSKPASLTSKNSLTDRSLVKSRLARMSCKRSRAWSGRSSTIVGLVGFVQCEGVFFGFFRGALDLGSVVVIAPEGGIAAPLHGHHRQHQRRYLARLRLPTWNSANAGAKPAHFDVQVVELAAA